MNERNFFIDNAKAILIFLIILSHYAILAHWEINLPSIQYFLGLNVGICSFQMAALIFINGYLTRHIKTQRKKDIITLLIPYLFIQILTYFLQSYLQPSTKFELGIPIFANWYILALFIWRLIAPYFDYIKYPIITSIIISLLIGFLNDFSDFLDLQRIFAFLPYFIMGRYLSSKHLDFVFKNKPKIKIHLLLFIIIMSGFIISSILGIGIRKIYVPITNFKDWIGDIPVYMQFATRIFMLVSSSIIAYIFFQIVPRQKTWYSKYGQQLIYAICFHMFFLFPLFHILGYTPMLYEIIAIPLSILIIVILNMKQVTFLLQYFLNPFLLLKRNKTDY